MKKKRLILHKTVQQIYLHSMKRQQMNAMNMS